MEDQVMFGPISFFAVAFDSPTPEVKRAVKKQLTKLRKSGVIRVLDAVYAHRDDTGSVKTVAASDLTTDDKIMLGAAIGGLVGYGMAGDEGAEVGMVAGGLAAAEGKKGQGIMGQGLLRDYVRDIVPNETSVLVMLVEHLWAKDFKQSLSDAQAVPLANYFVTPEMFVEAGVELAVMAELAEALEESDFYLIEE